ncbi:MAG: hypothetical protein KKB50_00210 [Planctomycetes bacterium]|nr:hypothetical protein [Planctomycetota bacterium]
MNCYVKINKKAYACDPIHLGDPIHVVELHDLDHEKSSQKQEHRKRFFNVMLGWALQEQTALTWRHMKLPFRTVVPYKTGRLPDFDAFEYATYGSPDDIGPATRGLGVLLIAYKSLLDAAEKAAVNTAPQLQTARTEIQQLLKSLKKLAAKSANPPGPKSRRRAAPRRPR